MTLALVAEVVGSPDRLAQLAETIRREYAATRRSAEEMLRHAIACGHALIEAKELVPKGEWTRWLEDVSPLGLTPGTLHAYIRLAHLEEHVDPTASMDTNKMLLRGLPGVSKGRKLGVVPEEKDTAIEAIRAGEVTITEAASRLHVSRQTVAAWVNPQQQENRVDRRRKRRHEASVAELTESCEPRRCECYGEPGRPALTKAIRAVGLAKGKVAVREALLDLSAVATAWAGRLR